MGHVRSAAFAVPAGTRRGRSLRGLAWVPRGRRLPEATWRARHRGLTLFLWGHVPALLAFGLLTGHRSGTVLPLVALVAVPALLAELRGLPPRVRSSATSFGLVVAASVLVHLWHGAIEAHFQYFVVLAFLALYQAWLPYVVALVSVVLEHGVIGTLIPGAVYDHPAAEDDPWLWAAIHGGFVLLASVANLMAWGLTERAAHRDPGTGLPNRVAALDHLRELVDRGRPVVVVVLEPAEFADVNAAFGHALGDELLQQTARRLRQAVHRDAETFVARLGGGEFALIAPAARGDAERYAELAAQVCDRDFVVDGIDLRLSPRVGLAHTADLVDPDAAPVPSDVLAADLVRAAELAAASATSTSDDRPVAYRDEMLTAATARAQLLRELRRAIDRQEFVLHYQPLVDARSHAVVGAEALLRWQHPERGLLPPSEVIEIAESSGMILPLGEWITGEACRRLAAWRRDGVVDEGFVMSVNLSAVQLASPTVVGMVAQALSDAGAPPRALQLEVTEAVLVNDVGRCTATLAELRELGVRLTLDDFGTGYSSLSYLTRLPVQGLKIDRSFTAALATDRQSQQIVTAVVTLSHALGLSVTAEGVETFEQAGRLSALGVRCFQGYLFGRPVPAEVFAGHRHDERLRARSRA